MFSKPRRSPALALGEVRLRGNGPTKEKAVADTLAVISDLEQRLKRYREKLAAL